MVFCIVNGSNAGFCCRASNLSILCLNRPSPAPKNPEQSVRRTNHIAFARRVSSRTNRLGKPKKTVTTEEPPPESTESPPENVDSVADDDYFLPELPGDKQDFWEGPQWDWLGFFAQYMWAFGIGFALIACGIAVATYNEGATDFKQTPVYKESIQSRELFEEPDASNSDVFESNPTEEAPSLE